MDGFPALDLWNRVIEVLRSTNNTVQPNQNGIQETGTTLHSKTKVQKVESQLYIFEHNEPVIKMIIKGRSPTMRHVSRTHRVALDWLVDRINMEPKIQIKNVDTKNQLADILTKGSFSSNE